MRPILYTQVTSLSAAKLLCAGLSVIASEVIAVPGGGYAVGDVVTVAGGTFSIPATYRVTAVKPGGGVTGLARTSSGVATSKPSNPASVTGGTGTGLTLTLTWTDNAVPPGARAALIQADAQAVRWRDDGVAPTASVGMYLAVNSQYLYDKTAIGAIKVIEVTSGASVSVTFYG